MATVRFSEKLRSDIYGNARDLFRDKIEAAKTNYPNDAWASAIYNGMYGEYRSAMEALPENFFERTTRIDFNGFNGMARQSIRLSLPDELPMPYARILRNGAATFGLHQDYRGYGGVILDADDARWNSLRAEYQAYIEQISAVENARVTFVQGVEKITLAYSTLAPALKAWPPLWDLVPDHVQLRHKEIVERVKRTTTPQIEGVDLNQMTGISVAAKFTK